MPASERPNREAQARERRHARQEHSCIIMANGSLTMNAWLRHVMPESVTAEQAGVVALGLFALLAPQGHAGAKWGLLLLALAAVPHWRELARALVRDPLFHVVWVLALYILVRAAFAAQALPETAAAQWEAALGFGLGGFYVLLVAWWLRGDPRRVALLGALAVAGLCMEILVDGRPVAPERILRGAERHLVGSALPMGLLGGLGLLVIITGMPAAVAWARRHSRWMLVGLVTAALLATILLATLQVITQSRAVLGLLLLVVPAVVAVDLMRPAGHAGRRATASAFAAVLVVVLGGAIFLVGPKLVDKMEREIDQAAPYFDSGNPADIPDSSLGWRLQLLDLGREVGADRPWFGWGPGTSTTRHMLERYDRERLAHLHHLHNTPLEIWVRLGLAGVLLYAGVLCCLVRSAVQGAKTSRMPSEVMSMLAASVVLVGGYSLVEFRMLSWDFGVAIVMLAAVAHTFGRRDARRSSLDRSNEPHARGLMDDAHPE